MEGIGRVSEVDHPETHIEGDKDHHVIHELEKEPGLAPEEDLLSNGGVLPGVVASLSLLVVQEVEVLLESLCQLHRLSAHYVGGLANLPHSFKQILIIFELDNSLMSQHARTLNSSAIGCRFLEGVAFSACEACACFAMYSLLRLKR